MFSTETVDKYIPHKRCNTRSCPRLTYIFSISREVMRYLNICIGVRKITSQQSRYRHLPKKHPKQLHHFYH